MLFWIAILGGLLIMMGQRDRSEAFFYYFRLEDQVPETHLLRLIDKHISFALCGKGWKESYSDTGRPSIDPELLPTFRVTQEEPPRSVRLQGDCAVKHDAPELPFAIGLPFENPKVLQVHLFNPAVRLRCSCALTVARANPQCSAASTSS